METDNSKYVHRFFEWADIAMQQLKDNLLSLGYEFRCRGEPFQFSDSDLLIVDVERRFGQLPIAYKALYRKFCFIDFRQSDSQLHDHGSKVGGLGLNCPLVFAPVTRIEKMRAEIVRCGGIIVSDRRNFLPTGSAASNCEPKGVWVPSSDIDPVLFDEGAGPVTLMDEIRNAILAGGFPFWKFMFRRSRHTSPLGFSPPYPNLLPYLLHNIEPPPSLG